MYTVHDTIPVFVENINTPVVVNTMDTLTITEDGSLMLMSMEALYNNGLISDIDNNFNELSFSLETNSDSMTVQAKRVQKM